MGFNLGYIINKVSTQITSRTQKTIQTHNAVSIPGTGTNYNDSSFIDCNGFDNLAVTATNDASTSSIVYIIWSNDGVNTHGYESVSNGTLKNIQAQTPIKSRWARVRLLNSDTTTAHTMNAWAYLKA